MKFRNSGREGEKIEPAMAPMIDVVFQLLIFFMLTLKIVEPEGNFNINMPVAAQAAQSDPVETQEYKVRITAGADGSMADLRLGGESLGSGPDAFERLRVKVLDLVGGSRRPEKDDVEIEIQADYGLHYESVIAAVSACTGRMQKNADGEMVLVRYVEKIKFAPAVGGPNAGS